MTPHEVDLAIELSRCGIYGWSSQRRFVRDLAYIAKNDPGREVTLRQRHYLELLAWRYRRQLPPHLVPHRKPLDLPDARRPAKAARIRKSRRGASQGECGAVQLALFAA